MLRAMYAGYRPPRCPETRAQRLRDIRLKNLLLFRIEPVAHVLSCYNVTRLRPPARPISSLAPCLRTLHVTVGRVIRKESTPSPRLTPSRDKREAKRTLAARKQLRRGRSQVRQKRSTGPSRVVPHRSTTPARTCLTSLFGWEAVSQADVAALSMKEEKHPMIGPLSLWPPHSFGGPNLLKRVPSEHCTPLDYVGVCW